MCVRVAAPEAILWDRPVAGDAGGCDATNVGAGN